MVLVSRGVWSAEARILMASPACATPIMPTTGPMMPASPQETIELGGGGFRKQHL